MNEEDRLAELFRAAASDAGAPAAGFDHAEVVAASRRITARRRTALIGAGFAALVLVGAGGAISVLDSVPTAATVAAPAPEAAPEAVAPDGAVPGAAAPEGAAAEAAARKAAGSDASGPEAGAARGSVADQQAPARATPFHGTPLGPAAGDCAQQQDPRLRGYLEQVLPEVAGAPAASATTQCRPAGERYLALEVTDHGLPGLLSVRYLPPGADAAPVPGELSATTASGGTVLVGSRPVGGTVPGPFTGRLGEVVAFLAPRL